MDEIQTTGPVDSLVIGIPTAKVHPGWSYGEFTLHDEVYLSADGEWFYGLLLLDGRAYQASAGTGSNNSWYMVGADRSNTFNVEEQLGELRRNAERYGHKRVR